MNEWSMDRSAASIVRFDSEPLPLPARFPSLSASQSFLLACSVTEPGTPVPPAQSGSEGVWFVSQTGCFTRMKLLAIRPRRSAELLVRLMFPSMITSFSAAIVSWPLYELLPVSTMALPQPDVCGYVTVKGEYEFEQPAPFCT